MGTLIQCYELVEADYRGERFADHAHDLRGDADVLSLVRPDIVLAIHGAYLDAGADIIETNTFTATRIAQADYGLTEVVREMNHEAARLARQAADRAERPSPPGRATCSARSAPPTGRPPSRRMSPTRAPATSRSTSWRPPTRSRPRGWSRAGRTCW